MSHTRANAVTRTCLALGCLAVLALWPALVRSASVEDRPFTVSNYPVDASAKDAVEAKAKAIEEGQQAAFRSLLKRIVPVTAYNRMARVKLAKASQYLEGFAVRAERNSRTQYIASLDFSFQADAVRALMRSEGVPFVDTQARKTILIPLTRTTSPADAASTEAAEGAGGLVAATGTWRTVWDGLDLNNALTPVQIEAPGEAIAPETVQQLLAGNIAGVSGFASTFKSDLTLVAIAETDKAAGRVHVSVLGQDAVGPISWKRSYRLDDGDVDYTMELAAVITLGVIEGRWKAAKSGVAGAASALGLDIAIEAEFNSINEWNDIRGRLLNMPGIGDLRIGAVSARNAELTLKFPGGPGLLANELAPQGLTLRNTLSGWLLTSSY